MWQCGGCHLMFTSSMVLGGDIIISFIFMFAPHILFIWDKKFLYVCMWVVCVCICVCICVCLNIHSYLHIFVNKMLQVSVWWRMIFIIYVIMFLYYVFKKISDFYDKRKSGKGCKKMLYVVNIFCKCYYGYYYYFVYGKYLVSSICKKFR